MRLDPGYWLNKKSCAKAQARMAQAKNLTGRHGIRPI